MKKLSMIFCGCFLIVAMSFTACGNSDSGTGIVDQQATNATLQQQTTNAVLEQQSTSAVSESKQETSQYDNNKYASIADYVASDEVQKSIELLSGMEEALKSVLEGQKSVFINAANELKNEVNVDNPVVTVTYLDKNGDLIYSQDFAAN